MEHVVCRKDMASTTQETMQGDDAREDMTKQHQAFYSASNLVRQSVPYSMQGTPNFLVTHASFPTVPQHDDIISHRPGQSQNFFCEEA
jgi:hypothetical protein